MTKSLFAVGALLAALAVPASALAPRSRAERSLQVWQASRIVRSHAALEERPDFRIESTRRMNRLTVRVCWSEPGYLSPADGRDAACDLVQLRGGSFWLRDGSIMEGRWIRWL